MSHNPSLPGQSLSQIIEEILRVDHAGEVSAACIYAGQSACLPKGDAYRVKIDEMHQQEKEHLQAFENLLREHKVRPSLLLPLWQSLGFSLGVVSGLLGKRVAMACTIAVEETIEEHYSSQIAQLKAHEGTQDLVAQLEQFLRDEVHHKEEAVSLHGESAPFYPFISRVVKLGCKVAIQVAQKI